MTHDEHRQRHVELHKKLDELLADYLVHNPDKGLTNSTIVDLMLWSAAQTKKPVERTGGAP